jgi:hypothetical protein
MRRKKEIFGSPPAVLSASGILTIGFHVKGLCHEKEKQPHILWYEFAIEKWFPRSCNYVIFTKE